MRKIEQISIGAADRERLERLVRGGNTPQNVVWRGRIVLLAGDGLTAEGIAATVGKSLLTVRPWRRRYVAMGVDGLLRTRPSRVKPLTPEKIKQVVDMTLNDKPPNATHWSVRSMAAVAGISYSNVQRIWCAHGLKSHLIETFKVSKSVHPLQGPTLRALRPLQGAGPYVFVTEAGTPVTTAWFLRMVQRTGRAAGLPFPVHPHMLRHSTGFKLANYGGPRTDEQFQSRAAGDLRWRR
jgi:integrase